MKESYRSRRRKSQAWTTMLKLYAKIYEYKLFVTLLYGWSKLRFYVCFEMQVFNIISDFYSASGPPENCLLTICVVSVSLWIEWYDVLAHSRCGATYHSITPYLESWCLMHFHIFMSVPTTYWNEPMRSRKVPQAFAFRIHTPSILICKSFLRF